MDRTRAALALFALAGTAAAWWIAAASSRTPDPPPTPPPAPAPAPPPPAPPLSDLEAVAWRSRDEGILFVRRRPWGLPASRVEVVVFPAGGLEDRRTAVDAGRTDGTGVLRFPLPFEGAVDFRIDDGEGTPLLGSFPPAPPPDAGRAPAALFADRTVLRPGDRVRVAVPQGSSGPDLVVGPRLLAEGVPPVAFGPERGDAGPPGAEGWWRVLEGTVPDDSRPGTVLLEAGGGSLALPLVARFGEEPSPPPDPDSGTGPPPATDAGGGPLRLEPADGGWRVSLPPLEEGAAVLLFARTPERFLTHAAVVPREREVILPLPDRAAPGKDLRVTVAASTREGILQRTVRAAAARGSGVRLDLEGESPSGPVARLRIGEGAPAPHLPMAAALEDPSGGDPEARLAVADLAGSLPLPAAGFRPGTEYRMRAVAARGPAGDFLRAETTRRTPGDPPAPRPAFLREGDRPEGAFPGAERLPAPPRDLRAVLRPGETAALLDGGKPLPPGTEVRWEVVAPPGSAGPVRVRAGRGIVLETLVGAAPAGGGPGGGRTGTIRAGSLGDRDLALESAVEGLRAVVFRAERPDAGPDLAPLDEGIAVRTLLPSAGREGETVGAGVEVAAPGGIEGPVEVLLPLPAGAVPAEDGWSIAAAAPEGTRVRVDRRRVAWTLPSLPAAGVRLPVRLRLVFPGTYLAPAATAVTGGPDGARGRSADGRIRID